MLNQVVFVGKLETLPTLEKKYFYIQVARKENENDELIIDKIKIDLSDPFIEQLEDEKNNFKDFLKIGDIVGIKGKVQNENRIVVEKMTFLSSQCK